MPDGCASLRLCEMDDGAAEVRCDILVQDLVPHLSQQRASATRPRVVPAARPRRIVLPEIEWAQAVSLRVVTIDGPPERPQPGHSILRQQGCQRAVIIESRDEGVVLLVVGNHEE